MEIFTLVVPLLLEGLKVFGEERRTRFKDKYYKHIKTVAHMMALMNTEGSSYTDTDLCNAEKSLKLFLKAYKSELMNHNNEVGND